jgi:hypothetical protein
VSKFSLELFLLQEIGEGGNGLLNPSVCTGRNLSPAA